MKVSREQAARHREQILKLAAQRFREQGFDGVGVADLMKAAGLTHGGFYGHFSSKEDLAAQACAQAFAERSAWWEDESRLASDRPLKELAEFYLTGRHRDHAGLGCPAAALAIDTSRQPAPVRRAFTAGLERFIEFLSARLPGRAKARRKTALAAWSTLVGAMALARAVDDPALSDEILSAAADAVTKLDA